MKTQSSHIRAYCIILMILIVSIWSIINIEFGDDSKKDSGSFTIVFKHFGRDPKNIEKTITIPLEISLRNVRGLDSISSRSELGSAKLYLFMKPDYNFESAYIDIRDAVYGLYSGLPSSVQKPQIYSGNNLQQPEIIFTLNSDLFNRKELQNIAEKNIKPMLENIKEAGEIQIGGGALNEILLHVNRKKAAQLGITQQDLSELLNNSYIHNSVNKMIDSNKYYSIVFEGRFDNPKELSDVFVTNKDGKKFPLSSIAWIEKTVKNPETISRLNGEQKLIFYIKSSGRGSIITLSDKIKDVFNKWNNSGLDFEIIKDRGNILKKAIFSLIINIIVSVVVVGFFIVLGLKNIKIALPTALSLPFNALISLAVFNAAGLTIGISSLLGIGLAIGAVADSGIIIASYITNESKGQKLLSKEIKLSLVSSALTTVIVTMPILLSAQIALDAKRIALSFFIFIIVSTITNMSLLPGLIASEKTWVNNKLKKFRRKTEYYILWALKMKTNKIFWASIFLVLLFLSGILFTPQRIDSGLDESSLPVHVELKGGASLNSVDSHLSIITDKLKTILGVSEVESFAKRENGTISVKYDRKTISKQKLINIVESYNDLFKEASVIVLKDNSKDTLSIPVRIQGSNIKTIKEILDQFSFRLKNETWVNNIIYHFKEGGPVVSIKTLEHSRVQNFTPQMINQHIHWAIQGPVSIKWLDKSDEYDLRIVSNTFDSYKSLSEIKSINIYNGETFSPLSNLVSFSLSNENTAIFRNNLQRSLELSVITEAGDINKIFNKIENILKDISMPSGYRYKIDDSIVQKRDEFRMLLYFIIAAVLLIYIVLSATFESILLPLLIILNIPISLAPCFIVINIFGIPFTSRVFVGFIIVTGIIVNNSILITEKTMNYGITALNVQNRVFKSVKQRLSSLLMTTASTCVGLLPIVLGFGQSESVRFLALVIFFGVLFSFIFGIFLYPAILFNFLKLNLMHKQIKLKRNSL